MCRCTPEIKTPFCGKPGCEWPKQTPMQHMIKGMIDAVLKLGRKPVEIYLTEDNYERLVDELSDWNDPGYEVDELGNRVLYHEKKWAKPIKVNQLFGLPIRISYDSIASKPENYVNYI